MKPLPFLLPILLSMVLLAASSVAQALVPPPADDAVFVEGTRYDAVLDPHAGTWRLLSPDDPERRLRVADRCLGGTPPPAGLWLLTRDEHGDPELVALSSTPLPPGHPGRIAMVDCGPHAPRPSPEAIGVPPGLRAWLQQHSGTIYVTP